MKNMIVLLAFLACGSAQAFDKTISNCKIRASIPGGATTAAFLTIDTNKPGLSLTGANISELTKDTQLHEMTHQDGVMKMQQIKKLDLKEGKTTLKSGGYHLMLMDLEKPAKVGETYRIVLDFSDNTKGECEASVVDVRKEGHQMKQMHHSM